MSKMELYISSNTRSITYSIFKIKGILISCSKWLKWFGFFMVSKTTRRPAVQASPLRRLGNAFETGGFSMACWHREAGLDVLVYPVKPCLK